MVLHFLFHTLLWKSYPFRIIRIYLREIPRGQQSKVKVNVFLPLMVNFLLRKIFHENLNEAMPLTKFDATLKVSPISTNEIASFRLSRKSFLDRKLTLKLPPQRNWQIKVQSLTVTRIQEWYADCFKSHKKDNTRTSSDVVRVSQLLTSNISKVLIYCFLLLPLILYFVLHLNPLPPSETFHWKIILKRNLPVQLPNYLNIVFFFISILFTQSHVALFHLFMPTIVLPILNVLSFVPVLLDNPANYFFSMTHKIFIPDIPRLTLLRYKKSIIMIKKYKHFFRNYVWSHVPCT